MPVSVRDTLARTPTKDALTRFIRYSSRFATNTQRQYKDTLSRLQPYLPDYIEQIRAEHLDIFVNSLKMLNSSKNTTLIPVRSFLQFCEDYFDVPSVAKKVKDLPEQPHKQRCLSENEYAAVLKVCSEQEKAIVQILACTGLRASEFCDLTPNSISPDETFLTVIGKGRKRRCVPLNNTACQAFFTINLSKNFNRDSLSYICKCLAKRASLPAFGPHAFRHFFCTRLIKAGVPIAKVSKILGHSSIAVTEKTYLHLLPSDTLGCTDVLDF